MDDHVGQIRRVAADLLLDLTRARVCLGQRAARVETERQEHHQPLIGAEKPQLARPPPRRLLHDADDRLFVAGNVLRRQLDACGLFGKRLQMGLDGRDLRSRRDDRLLDIGGNRMAAAWIRSRSSVSATDGSTWTTTSLSGNARSIARSTASAAACPCPTAAAGETPITTSAKCLPAACRMRSRFSSTGGWIPRMAAWAAS